VQRIRYFIRDDDVGELTDALRFFVETFVERRLPVSYQIIPSLLTSECAEYLRQVEAANAGLIEFGQHGLTHRMKWAGQELDREFGPERSLDEQRAVIGEGLALLKAHLGERRIAVFTPPRHKYDGNTVRAAAEAGLTVFSAAYYPTVRHQAAYALGRRLGLSSLKHQGISYHGRERPEAAMREVSIAVDVDDGEVARYAPEAISGIVRRASRYTDTIGFMFHHFMYATPDARQTLVALADRLAAYGEENFHRLGALGEGQ
jgi:hypothetical protein